MARRLYVPFLLLLVLAACAPAAGRPVLAYHAQAEDVISEIAAIGVEMQPGSAYDFYSITAIGDRFVTLQANTTAGFSLFFGGSRTALTFSATQSGDVTRLAVSSQGNRQAGNDSIDEIIQQLDARFDRGPVL